MKKWAAVLSLGLCMALTACGKDETENKQPAVEMTSVAEKLKSVGDYKTFTYEEYTYEVNDEEIMDYYESMTEYYIELGYKAYEKDESRDGSVVADGDTINIDYTGYVDDVAFEGGAATGYDLTIGSGAFIDGFESSLVGKTVGETLDINVTFPEEYPNNPDLAGAEAVFTVTINYVGKEITLTTENAYSEIFGYDSMEAINVDIKAALEAQYAASEESYYENKKSEYIEMIMEASEFEDLSSEIETLTANEMAILETAAVSGGSTSEVYAMYYGYESLEDYETAMREKSEVSLKKSLVANEIAELEGIILSDEKFEELVLPEIQEYGYTDVSVYEAGYDSQYGTGMFRQSVFTTYVFDTIFEKYAVMSSAEAE